MKKELDVNSELIRNSLVVKKYLTGCGQWHMRFSGEASVIQYVVSITSLDMVNLQWFKSNVDYDFFYNIETRSLVGFYFQFCGVSMLIICPKIYVDIHDIKDFNLDADAEICNELMDYSIKNRIPNINSIDYEAFISLAVEFQFSLALKHSLEFDELKRIKICNSIDKYFYNFNELTNSRYVQATSHISAFSWIYFIEVKFIMNHFQYKDNILIHDIATNTANLPILLQRLNNELNFHEKFNIHCSDIDISQAIENTSLFFKDNEHQISIGELNLMEDISSLKKYEVLVLNDVLEHFDDEISYQIFSKIWEATREILIIHVPIEEQANELYGHRTTFTRQKLDSWCQNLKNCQNLTSAYIQSLINPGVEIDGFLFLRKVGENYGN